MTTELIKELVELAVEKAYQQDARLIIDYVAYSGVTIKIITFSCDVSIIESDRSVKQTPAQLQAAIDRIKEL